MTLERLLLCKSGAFVGLDVRSQSRAGQSSCHRREVPCQSVGVDQERRRRQLGNLALGGAAHRADLTAGTQVPLGDMTVIITAQLPL